MRGKYTSGLLNGDKLALTQQGSDVLNSRQSKVQGASHLVHKPFSMSSANAQMLHANTDIKNIMSMKIDRAKQRTASGQRRFIPQQPTGGASAGGKRGAFDAEGAQLRKDLASINTRKRQPLDQKEDAKLRQQAMIMLEENKKPVKDNFVRPGTQGANKPPSSQQGKRPTKHADSTANNSTISAKTGVEKALQASKSNKRIIIDADGENKQRNSQSFKKGAFQAPSRQPARQPSLGVYKRPSANVSATPSTMPSTASKKGNATFMTKAPTNYASVKEEAKKTEKSRVSFGDEEIPVRRPNMDDSDDDGDVSSDWSAKDSIDLEVKEMRRQQRKNKNNNKPDKPTKLMIEKELKKGELGQNERHKLKEIVNKGKMRPGQIDFNSVNADKVAKEIIDNDRYDAAGLDSSIDSDEFDDELRDKVEVEGQPSLDDNLSSGDEDEDFSKNTDLSYYTMMSADEKLMTLRNRAQLLHLKHREMMKEMKTCEQLYPTSGYHANFKHQDEGSDDDLSNLSGYSSSAGGDFNSLRFMGELRQGTISHLEEGKSSTADDTEASQAQTSVHAGDSSSVASRFAMSSPKQSKNKVGFNSSKRKMY